MGVATLDAALLGAEPPALAEHLRGLLDGPTLVSIRGNALPHLAPGVGEVLASVAALTVAVDDAAPADFVDLLITDDRARDVEAAFDRAPLAAVAGALLLRAAPRPLVDGLVAESATYSTLQAGPEFEAWRAARPQPDAEAVDDRDGDRVRVEQHRGLREIVLARSRRHNALDVRMRDDLHRALVDAAWSDDAVLLRGDGPSFCSGGDLDEFGTFPDPTTAHLVRLDRSLALAMAALAHRLVVALHGSCLGAGIELPAFAGYVVATSDTRIGLPEQAMGLVPGAGGTVSIARRAGRHAVLALLLHDGTVDAEHAHAIGLVDEVVAPAELRERAVAAARGTRVGRR